MNKEKVLDSLSFVVGAITIVCAVILKDNIVMAGIVAGCGASIYGLLKALGKTTYGYIILSVGLGLVASLTLYKFSILDRPDALTFMICLSTFLLMLVTFIFDYLNRKAIFKLYSLKCEAEVIDLVKNPNTRKDYFQVMCSYELNEKYYTVGTPGYIGRFIPKMGDKINIYVNPLDNADVYFDKDIKEKIYETLLGLFLMLASLIIIITLFI